MRSIITQAGANRSRRICWAIEVRLGLGDRGRCRGFEKRRLGVAGGTGRDFHVDAMSDADAAVDPPFLRDRLEKILPVSDGLGVSQKEKAPVAQGEVKQGDDLPLHLLVQVDQEVAADDQVQPGEGRIGGDVLRGENDPFAEALDDLIAAVPAGKEPLEPLGRDVLADLFRRIAAGAGLCQRGEIGVGGEDLKVRLPAALLRLLGQQHGQAVDLLSRGTAGNPDPDFRSRRGVSPGAAR